MGLRVVHVWVGQAPNRSFAQYCLRTFLSPQFPHAILYTYVTCIAIIEARHILVLLKGHT